MHKPSLNRSARSVALALAILVIGAAAASAQAVLDPATQTKFVNPLPIPARIDATDGGYYNAFMRETTQWLGLRDGDGNKLMTTVWGYWVPPGTARGDQGRDGRMGKPTKPAVPPVPTYPGPTLVTMKDVPVEIHWKNELPPYNMGFPGVGGHLLPVDPTLHMARPVTGGIPLVTHLHGGHTESASDGLPEAWFTQDFEEVGPQFVKQKYYYDNDQEAGTLWYHDHALGITRLNVYAGLAGFYLLRDDNELNLTNTGVLPGGPYEIEIVFQDRMFTEDGELFYPSTDPDIEPGFEPLPAGPSAIAEFFGDFILVNGAVWPKLDVEPRKYRFRFLNGADSRFFIIELRNDQLGGTRQEFMQIGTDDALLEQPVVLDRLLLAPGERADMVFDFSSYPEGTELYLRNLGPDDPFKGFNDFGDPDDGDGGSLPPADPSTTGQLMKFVVSKPFNDLVADATVDVATSLRPAIEPLVQDGATRQLALFEGLDEYGRLQPLLGTLAEGSLAWFETITENPMLNDVEIWEVYNATEDAHPIHQHLVAFQIIDRESFEGYVEEKDQPQHDGSFGVGGVLHVTGLGGDARGPEPNEMGWKDTAVMLPGEVTRVIAKYDREGRYVWHCHILSHEDHEMMRPYYVGPMPAMEGGMLAEGEATDGAGDQSVQLLPAEPNPFNPSTRIAFKLPSARNIDLRVFDLRGRMVRTLASGSYPAGRHSVEWNGRTDGGTAVPSGVYFYRLRSGETVRSGKMLLVE